MMAVSKYYIMNSNQSSFTQEVDKLGQPIVVKTTDKIGGSEMFTFFLKQMAELIDNGHGNPVTSWTDDNGAVYVTDTDGKILGHIVYFHNSEKRMIWITLSAVAAECRGRGLYKVMHKHLEQIGRDLDCTSIQSIVHVSNKVRLASAKSVGMTPSYFKMYQRL
jgi:hypothetical protein